MSFDIRLLLIYSKFCLEAWEGKSGLLIFIFYKSTSTPKKLNINSDMPIPEIVAAYTYVAYRCIYISIINYD